MDSIRNLVARGDGTTNDSIVNLLIAVLSLLFFGLMLLGLLFMFRRMRRQRQMRAEVLPQYYDVDVKRTHNHRGLTIQTGQSNDGRASVIVINQDRQPMLSNPRSPPHSPDNVPQIHITFPDEHDDQGRTKSGRVLLVRVGDNAAVGLEPLSEEQLPAYEKDSKSQFYAVDLDKIGGLKEKEYR
jgi:cbb3-type cytochrome oxidase subunit 3